MCVFDDVALLASLRLVACDLSLASLACFAPGLFVAWREIWGTVPPYDVRTPFRAILIFSNHSKKNAFYSIVRA